MQEHEIQQDMDRLTDEKEELEQKKQDLQDPKKLEQKARDELGLVKPGEMPYVKWDVTHILRKIYISILSLIKGQLRGALLPV